VLKHLVGLQTLSSRRLRHLHMLPYQWLWQWVWATCARVLLGSFSVRSGLVNRSAIYAMMESSWGALHAVWPKHLKWCCIAISGRRSHPDASITFTFNIWR